MVVLPAEVEVDFVGEVVRMLEVVVAVKNLVSQYPPFPCRHLHFLIYCLPCQLVPVELAVVENYSTYFYYLVNLVAAEVFELVVLNQLVVAAASTLLVLPLPPPPPLLPPPP